MAEDAVIMLPHAATYVRDRLIIIARCGTPSGDTSWTRALATACPEVNSTVGADRARFAVRMRLAEPRTGR